ncbi:hypothetical protein EDB85DRAFT_1876357 [Lactarius pseudohatsudake]|nr:hypothetical protein EDB85DRAFT_1876357 [Lactarius pseudohatsudake]
MSQHLSSWVVASPSAYQFLCDCVERQPDIALKELLQTELREALDAETKLQTIARSLQRAGYTMKTVTRHALERNELDRAEFRTLINTHYSPEQLVFADESHFNRLTLRRPYAWSILRSHTLTKSRPPTPDVSPDSLAATCNTRLDTRSSIQFFFCIPYHNMICWALPHGSVFWIAVVHPHTCKFNLASKCICSLYNFLFYYYFITTNNLCEKKIGKVAGQPIQSQPYAVIGSRRAYRIGSSCM